MPQIDDQVFELLMARLASIESKVDGIAATVTNHEKDLASAKTIARIAAYLGGGSAAGWLTSWFGK